MLIGDANPGDVVALDEPGRLRVFEVGSLFGVRWRKGVRRGQASAVLVDRLDVDSLRRIPFAEGYTFASALVDASLEVELIASIDFMRRLRLVRYLTAGRVAAFETAAARDGDDVDPMRRQQSNAADAASLEWFAEGKEIPF